MSEVTTSQERYLNVYLYFHHFHVLLLLSITIDAMNLPGAINKGPWEKVVMDYFQEDFRTILTENESDDEEIPDLGKNIFKTLQCLVMGKEHQSTVLLSRKKLYKQAVH